MSARSYDVIIVGGGAAGLSLACHLVRSPLRDWSILIVDREAKSRNDRTWCFWADRPTLFDGIVHRSWRRLRFAGEDFEKTFGLRTYRYKMVRGIDFYEFARRDLQARGSVEFAQATVEHIEDGADRACVFTGAGPYTGRWVFDSRFRLSGFRPDPARYHFLRQRFAGWEIETAEELFDPETATLMDFRTPQDGEMRFFYVLPFSRRHALVEYVVGTAAPPSGEAYRRSLQCYIETVLGIGDYRIVAREGGASPLTDQPFPRRAGRRVMTIGIAGGRIKPSSGYAFGRIQQDSAAIVRSLLGVGHPFDVPPDSRRYRRYDSIMLDVMARNGERIRPIFTTLFKNNPIERIFRFLDEAASPGEELALIASLPAHSFVQPIARCMVLREI